MPSPTSVREPAISVAGLRKSYGEHAVLDGVDLTVAAGTILALLGPNGAGKTTTVNILTTLIRAGGGTARVAGHDVATEADAVRAAIGATGQFSAVDDLLTGAENLRLMAALHHLPRAEGRRRAEELLDRFDLADAARNQVATYSGGMRRKLDLAMTLISRPRVVFLDEPTAGLDPRSRRTLWDSIGGLVADGVTILLTTQYLEEADQLADTVAVLDGGRIVARGTPAELKRRIPGGTIRLHFAEPPALAAAAAAFPDVARDDNTLALEIPAAGAIGTEALRAVLDRLDRSAIAVEHIEVAGPDLDDVFLSLTRHTTESDSRKVHS